MSDIDSGNSVILDVNLYETKRGKNNWSPILPGYKLYKPHDIRWIISTHLGGFVYLSHSKPILSNSKEELNKNRIFIV